MARRASSTTHPLWIAGVALLVILAGAIGYFLYSKVSDPYRTLSGLNVETFLENANSLRGNVYKIEGIVSDQLAYSRAEGRLFSIEVGESNNPDLLPILVPPKLNDLNIQKGQRFFFRIEVGDKGILRVQDIKKS
jgi:hypothetical protein